MAEARLIQAAETLARTLELDEDGQVAALRHGGFNESEAHRLIVLLPMAFSRPILEELGIRHFAPEVTAYDAEGTLVTAKLTRQPEYVGALRLAYAHRKKGAMNHEVYKRIAGSSSEIDVVSNALNQGMDIVGAAVATTLVSTTVARHLLR